jgi:desulfoferrodoxin (superoxide reductase-like protein)
MINTTPIDEDYNYVKQDAESLEKELGLPNGFLQELRDSDDWSFVIKVHALMEASVSYLLRHHFGDERLANVFDFMELSDKRRGKIAIVSALDLLPKFNRRFLAKLSELRNSVVHNINQVDFKLPEHVKSLEKQKFDEFIKAIEIDLNAADINENNEHQHRVEWVAKRAKERIFELALFTMALVYLKKEAAKSNRQISDSAIKIAESPELLKLLHDLDLVREKTFPSPEDVT